MSEIDWSSVDVSMQELQAASNAELGGGGGDGSGYNWGDVTPIEGYDVSGGGVSYDGGSGSGSGYEWGDVTPIEGYDVSSSGGYWYQPLPTTEYQLIDGEYWEVTTTPDPVWDDNSSFDSGAQNTTPVIQSWDSLLGDMSEEPTSSGSTSWDSLLGDMNAQPTVSSNSTSWDSLLGDLNGSQTGAVADDPYAINWNNLYAQLDGQRVDATTEGYTDVVYDVGNPYYTATPSFNAPSSKEDPWSFANIFKDIASITGSALTLSGNARGGAIATGIGALSNTATIKTGTPALGDLTKVLMTGLNTTLAIQKQEQTAASLNTGRTTSPTQQQQIATQLKAMTQQQQIDYIAQKTGTTPAQVASYLTQTKQNPYNVAYTLATQPAAATGGVPVKPSSMVPATTPVRTLTPPTTTRMPIKLPMPTTSKQQAGMMPITTQRQGFTSTSNQLVPYGTGATGEQIINLPAMMLPADDTPPWLIPAILAGAALTIILVMRKK